MRDGKTLLIAVMLPLAGIAVGAQGAESWRCSQAELERNVDVFYPAAPSPSPSRCMVYYSKPHENVMPRVLWSAGNDSGYCRIKAAEFVVRLQSWGWQCSAEHSQADAEPDHVGAGR